MHVMLKKGTRLWEKSCLSSRNKCLIKLVPKKPVLGFFFLLLLTFLWTGGWTPVTEPANWPCRKPSQSMVVTTQRLPWAKSTEPS